MLASHASRLARAALAIVIGIAGRAEAQAQSYPSRPVRLVVGNAPGGSDDFHGRLVAQKLTEALGQQFVVDNRSGSGGMVARTAVAKSPPDGYTLLLGAASMATSPYLYSKQQADSVRDFAPVSLVAKTYFVMIVHPSMPAKSVKEFIALARSRAGKINFGSTGVGGGPHLNAELFCNMAKIQATHIPYKGAGAGIYVDLLSGQLDFYIGPISTALAFIHAGKVRPLAVTGATRSTKLPDVPTMAEAALPGYEMSGWYAVFVPAGTPHDIVNALHAALAKQLGTAELRDALANVSSEARSSTPEELAKYLAAEIDRYGKLLKLAGIQPQ